LCRRVDVPYRMVRKRRGPDLGAYASAARHIRKAQPDIVMAHGTALVPPLLLLRAAGRLTARVLVRESQANHLKTRREWAASAFARMKADMLVYLSDEYRREIDARLPRPARGPVAIIPNGIDTEAIIPCPPREVPSVLSMVGRLVAIKDHPSLIEALRMLRDSGVGSGLRLNVVGEGPTGEALKAQARLAGVTEVVDFTGGLNRSEVLAVLQRTDIYVHSTFGETMSNSILEAMAAGLPIVASDVPGVSNLIRHEEDGLIVPPGNPAALATAIRRLLDSPMLRQELGRRARERVEVEFSRRVMVERYTDAWHSLVRTGENPAAGN
jgi:L-malate glycosyltransferase